jgi:predicted ATPase with chaperone activity
MNIQIEKNENIISVTADYNDEFVKVARTIADKNDEDKVKLQDLQQSLSFKQTLKAPQ